MILKKIFGSRNSKLVAEYTSDADFAISEWNKIKDLSDEELIKKAEEIRDACFGRDRAAAARFKFQAMAIACESAQRSIKQKPFKVQIIGALVLMDGKIAEMRTGEGKTLTSCIAAITKVLTGDKVHIVTVNDYLAERDSKWMGQVMEFIGVSVGLIKSDMDRITRKNAHSKDVVYSTSTELGFDFLRDNMVADKNDRVIRELGFAIIDEVDSVLIDEARTPLIISGPVDEDASIFAVMNEIALKMVKKEDGVAGDFELDLKKKQIHFTEDGFNNLENEMIKRGLIADDDSLASGDNLYLLYHATAALKAHYVYVKNINYLVIDGVVVIVDEFTGRAMPGRRWSDGLHQAMEVKEGCEVKPETQAAASVTVQNFFKSYSKISGMTGTADTEAYEFDEIYDLEVVVIPTNNPMIRKDSPDHVFISESAKIKHVVADVAEKHAEGRPVLIGTASIEMSERISAALSEAGLTHKVLNAKNHAMEAEIISDAGKPGMITVATNMAGRGTDIVLGGHKPDNDDGQWQRDHDAVVKSGGLHVIGTERHESRRMDNQLRGRAGRQGDPGSSRFYVSFEDHLIRLFAPAGAGKILLSLGMDPDMALTHSMVAKQIESAQQSVENQNFDIRKSLLQYDNIANAQRKAFYKQRNEILDAENDGLIEIVSNWAYEAAEVGFETVEMEMARKPMSDEEIHKKVADLFNNSWAVAAIPEIPGVLDNDDEIDRLSPIKKLLTKTIDERITIKINNGSMRLSILALMDKAWRDHILRMSMLRKGIHLRTFAQKKPEQEYSREAFELFAFMMKFIKNDCVRMLLGVKDAPKQIAKPKKFMFDMDKYSIRYEYTRPRMKAFSVNIKTLH